MHSGKLESGPTLEFPSTTKSMKNKQIYKQYIRAPSEADTYNGRLFSQLEAQHRREFADYSAYSWTGTRNNLSGGMK